MNTGAPSRRGQHFFTLAGIVMLVVALIGFSQFYFHGQAFPGRPLAPPIKSLILTHGIAMTLWLVLSIVQPLLIANGSRETHKKLGWFTAIVALFIVVTGIKLGIAATSIAPPEFVLFGLKAGPFMAVPVLSALLFAGFVAYGVMARRRPDAHRAAMFFASVAAISAAMARIMPLLQLTGGTAFERVTGPFGTTMVLSALLVVLHAAMTGSLCRHMVRGWVVATAGAFCIWWVAPTDLWAAVTSRLL